MNLEEARQLREELEAVEATMRSIKELWESPDFQSEDDLQEMARTASSISADMEAIKELYGHADFPVADWLEDLGAKVHGIRGDMEAIIAKTEELPSASDLE
jgi:hypothetical protein